VQPTLRTWFNHGDFELAIPEWTEVLGSERLTGALLDRLTHHVHILEMNGDSYRLKQSRRKRGS
jgi:DNA replication protein DnaC